MRLVTRTTGLFGTALLAGSVWLGACGGGNGDDSSSSAGKGATGGNGGSGATTTGGSATGGSATGGSGGAVTAGSGGSGGGATPVDLCLTKKAATTAQILDFEGGLGKLYVFADTSALGGTTTPADNTALKSGVKMPGADGSAHYFDFVGTGFKTKSYGGGIGVTLDCTDASGAQGISFWLKSDIALLAQVSNQADNPTVNGGLCAGDFSSCAQNSATVPAAAAWKEISLMWADFAGGKPNAAVDPAKLVGIGFVINAPADAVDSWGFDVSLDEIKWIGLPDAPAGGGGGSGGTGGGTSGGSGGTTADAGAAN